MKPERSAKKSLIDKYYSFVDRRHISDRIILKIVLLTVLSSLVWFLISLNNSYVTTVPTTGGTLIEGVVGTPRFVNPVLAITRADHDMVSLIYSGLVKLNDQGELVPDIAEKISVSEDGRTYNIKLRENVYFHNGSKLTVKDVAYTIALIQNQELKSPLRGNWDGILVEELGEYEMNIVLEEAYTPFIENLTVGILPRDLWDELPTEQLPFSQNNTEPVGSGPYKITEVLRNKSGLIKAYQLEAFNSNDNPNISTLVFNFYQNEDELLAAFEAKEISATVSLSGEFKEKINVSNYSEIERTLPRTFAIYFNQNKSIILRDKAVRQALDTVIDRQELINSVLSGYGVETDSPVPPGFIEYNSTSSTLDETEYDPYTLARSILSDGGWSQNEEGKWIKAISEEDEITLHVSIATANTPLFENTANFVAEEWRQLGVDVTVSQFEQADLVQAIIRPRNFEALLFGAEVGRSVDLYPFWHSSQKDDPGLNIAEYTNIDVDALLEDIRVTTDRGQKFNQIYEVSSLIKEDHPAIFLFSPTFRYIYDTDIQLSLLPKVNSQSDRFKNISSWHIKSDKVWPIFQKNN